MHEIRKILFNDIYTWYNCGTTHLTCDSHQWILSKAVDDSDWGLCKHDGVGEREREDQEIGGGAKERRPEYYKENIDINVSVFIFVKMKSVMPY